MWSHYCTADVMHNASDFVNFINVEDMLYKSKGFAQI